jgi:hypothetical protein
MAFNPETRTEKNEKYIAELETLFLKADKKTIQDVKLEGVENINYLQAIKRVIGMINKPLAN